MGNALSLIHLPAQSGKTRKMTELSTQVTVQTGYSKRASMLSLHRIRSC
jgi:hypothetical protein